MNAIAVPPIIVLMRVTHEYKADQTKMDEVLQKRFYNRPIRFVINMSN